MPQVIALVVVGAGLYAGYRWISRQLAAPPPKTDSSTPKDLGTLEYDAKAQVYRPRVK